MNRGTCARPRNLDIVQCIQWTLDRSTYAKTMDNLRKSQGPLQPPPITAKFCVLKSLSIFLKSSPYYITRIELSLNVSDNPVVSPCPLKASLMKVFVSSSRPLV